MTMAHGDERRRLPLLVVGAGVGGLCAALALARRGRAVHVIEQAEAFADIGYGIQLGPNATRILDALGVLDRLLPHAVAPRQLLYMDALSGERIASIDLGERFLARYGHPYLVVHRGDLQRALLDACGEQPLVSIETGRAAQAFEDRGSDATVRCADGTAYAAEAVVAADGLRSRARALLAPGELRAEGFVAYRGAVPLSAMTEHADADAMVMWVGPDMHMVQYKIRAGELFNQVAVFRSRRFASGDPDWGSPDELDACYAAFCAPVRAGAALLDRTQRYPMADREPIGTWTTERIALLGDAAHPMLPLLAQGGCQAIEDAAALADALGPDADVPAALASYERLRAPRAARVQTSARRFADVCHIGGVGIELRNALFARHDPCDYAPLDWLYDEAAVRGGQPITI